MNKSIWTALLALPLLAAILLIPTKDGWARDGGDRWDDHYEGRHAYAPGERHERHERNEREEWNERGERHERKERPEGYGIFRGDAIPGDQGALPRKYGTE